VSATSRPRATDPAELTLSHLRLPTDPTRCSTHRPTAPRPTGGLSLDPHDASTPAAHPLTESHRPPLVIFCVRKRVLRWCRFTPGAAGGWPSGLGSVVAGSQHRGGTAEVVKAVADVPLGSDDQVGPPWHRVGRQRTCLSIQAMTSRACAGLVPPLSETPCGRCVHHDRCGDVDVAGTRLMRPLLVRRLRRTTGVRVGVRVDVHSHLVQAMEL
jgi:hypothetical protein